MLKVFSYGVALAAFLAAGAVEPARAVVTAENFVLRTTEDLVALCDAKQGDPQAVAAIHQCTGFLVGVYQYHESINAGPRGRRIFCVPEEGAPNRDTAARMFVAWSPLGPVVMSNETFWFSFRLLKPEPWIAEKCAKRSLPPPSGVMKP